MPAFATEKSSVQEPIMRYSKELGWKILNQEDALRLRGGETGLILRQVFSEQLIRLNSDFANLETANIVIKRLEETIGPSIEGNLRVWEHLIGKGTVFVPAEKRDRDVKLIDFEEPERNEFHITEEFSYTNGIKTNRPDVVFFINGIPIFVLEAKAPHRLNGLDEGLTQIKRYHEETPELMKIPQVYQISNIIDFFYGPTWNFSGKSLFSWKIDGGSKLELEAKVSLFQ